MTTPETPESFEPRMPAFTAGVVFVLVALSIFYPLLSGQFLGGDDQLSAGFAFRQFGAEMHKLTGSIPQWNPYIFGGMPFSAVIGHGDIFYPTAWLRWFVATDTGMTIGFFAHMIIAGCAMYGLLRGLKTSWGAALIGGVAYEFSGIVVSQISPGHDGKMFVSSLAPFAFLALLRAIRGGKLGSYGLVSLVVGLAILSPQVQMAYYLLVACGLWTLWLVFFDPERRTDRPSWQPLAFGLMAVGLGLAIAAVQVIPVMTHVQYTPRGPGGDSGGWDYATSYAMPIAELMTTVLPQFNGMLENYWGSNFFKSHTEYLGALVVVLAILGLAPAKKKGLLTGFGVIAGLFLLVAFGGHTPFYRLWYTVMPMMNNVRAAGMAFYLVALPVCVLAGLGADRLLKGEVSRNALLVPLGVLGGLALLAASGLLQGMTVSLAEDPVKQVAIANADALRMGGLRLLLVVLVGGAILFAAQRGLVKGAVAAALIALAVAGDNWSILKHFAKWYPPAAITYADDELSMAMKKTPLPFRNYDPTGAGGQGAGVYTHSMLMAFRIPTLFGYHGMESKYFDALLGEKSKWINQLSPNMWDLYAIKYITLNQEVPQLPGYHKVMGPVSFPNLVGRNATPQGLAGYLYERDSTPQWVRVVPAAAKVPDAQIAPTVADPRFPVNNYVLYADTTTVQAGDVNQAAPAPSQLKATLAKWQPGAMTVKLDGAETRTTYLLVAENWYPDWKATVDGKPAPTHRADGALLSVVLPPGAREVTLTYDSTLYHQMMWVSWASALLALGLIAAGRFRRAHDA